MKKKNLNEGCACEGEERAPKHEEFISGDKVSRYILQMTDEELDRVDGFREILAGILDTETKNIKSFRRDGLGYRVKVVGGMKDLEKIMDKNVDVLKRLKGAEDEEWSDDEEDWSGEEDGWMTPEEMGIAQKIDWSDENGDDISDEKKMDYFRSKDQMYEVDEEEGKVRLKPEEDWLPSDDQDEDMDDDLDDDMEDWEREGYNSEIAYQNRWRDYED